MTAEPPAKIALAAPDLGEREEELVLETLRSGTLSLGPMGPRFERAFAEWLGVEDAVAVSSGTAGLHLGVRASGWADGDEVLTSPFSFVASANCLLYEGARPVFCDVDPETLDLDPAAAAAATGERTRGILPVHIFGWPAAMPALEEIASRHDLGVLEDACEALGAVDEEGRRVGTRGNLAVFAFYPNKQMTTGEGGIVIPPDAQAAARLRSERNQGRAADMGWLDHGGLGFNYRLGDMAAALGVAQVERLDDLLERRAAVADLYSDALAGIDAVQAPPAGRGAERRSWFVYPVRLAAGVDRDATIASLAERGIASKAYLPCIHLFPHLRELGYREGQFPVAEEMSRRSLALPFSTALEESQVARVCEALAQILPELMSRFRKDPDPRFWRLNRSIEFDWRLAPYDVDQSQAHARGLREIGVLDDEELAEIDAGLERVRARMGEHGFEFEEGDEDIHMAIERLLGEEIGGLAGKLHTGRSRNDQVATDVAMVVQAHSLRAIELCGATMERLLALADSHRDWAMPGYTHLQRAQPVYLGHHLLAYFWMLARDVLRFQFALDSASVMPLGSGALAGVNWEIDRGAVAEDLGFEHVSPNSIDGASNRDFVLDYLAAASACAMHLSRLGSEIVIWSSSEFGFCELDESFSSGSSIMPQKKNPDSAELLRAKAPRVAADYAALLGTMHALPLTYGKDMQEDKEPLFDAIDTVELCLDATEGMLAGIEFDRDRLEAASGDEMLAATEIADLLVRKGVPFREAHGIVGGLVRDAVERDKRLSELTPEELRERSEHLDEDYYEVLERASWLESKRIEGGTGSAPLAAQIDLAAETLAAVKARVSEEKE